MHIVVIEVIFPIKGQESALLSALKKLAQSAKLSLGCKQYELLMPTDASTGIMVIMRFDSENNLKKHEESDYVSAFVKENEGKTYNDFTLTKWKSL